MYLRGNLRVRLATQRKFLRKFNLRPLASTCRSVWPGLKFIYKRHGFDCNGLVTGICLKNRWSATCKSSGLVTKPSVLLGYLPKFLLTVAGCTKVQSNGHIHWPVESNPSLKWRGRRIVEFDNYVPVKSKLKHPPGQPPGHLNFWKIFVQIPPSRGRKAVQIPHYTSIQGDQMPPPSGNFSVASIMLRKLCM